MSTPMIDETRVTVLPIAEAQNEEFNDDLRAETGVVYSLKIIVYHIGFFLRDWFLHQAHQPANRTAQ